MLFVFFGAGSGIGRMGFCENLRLVRLLVDE